MDITFESPFTDEQNTPDFLEGEEFTYSPTASYDLLEQQAPHKLLKSSAARTVYQQKLAEALRKLDPPGGGGISFGAPSTSTGRRNDDWLVEEDHDFGNRFNPPRAYKMLVLKARIKPSQALRRIIEHPSDWSLDCAYFVQVAHLFALSSVNPAAFDNYFKSKRFLLRYHHSSGVAANFYFDKERMTDPWSAWYRKSRGQPYKRHLIKDTVKWTTDTIKQAMPIGSRLMWRCDLVKLSDKWAYRNENAVKVGNDQYRAFGLTPPAGSLVRYFTERQIKEELAGKAMNEYPGRHDPSLSVQEYAQRHVFLSEAQRFFTP